MADDHLLEEVLTPLTFTVTLHSEDRELQVIEVINAMMGDTAANPGWGLDNAARWRILRWATDRYRLPERPTR